MERIVGGRSPLEYTSQVVKDIGCRTFSELKKKAEQREELEECCQPASGLLT